MNKEDLARGGERIINEPSSGFEVEMNRNAKIVNTGISHYIEFEKHLQGFKDGEVLTYRKCQDGTSVILRGIEND